ncbi:hypothetical protein ACFLTE_00235 [Bacteroidota bacterium]
MNIDATAYYLAEGDKWWKGNASMFKLDIIVSKQLLNNLAIYGGPSFNVITSNIKDSEGVLIGSSITPWTTHDKIRKNKKRIEMYPGFNVGFRF